MTEKTRRAANRKRTYVLDTNVILHESGCIYDYGEHDIVVPITVIEELDNFKKGIDSLSFHARNFIRNIDALSGDKLFNGGVSIGEGKGRISVRFQKEIHSDISSIFSVIDKADLLILNNSYWLSKEAERGEVVLVSKDGNLRMKAKSLGLLTEDYPLNNSENKRRPYGGVEIVESSSETIDKIYARDSLLSPEDLGITGEYFPNEFLILKNGSKSALATIAPGKSEKSFFLRRVYRTSAFGVEPRNAEQIFAIDALLNQDIELVSITGKAGTGKTLLALAASLQMRDDFQQILLARPVVPLSNKDIGYLPGDVQSKISPYMQPLYDNLGIIKGQFSGESEKYRELQRMLDEKTLRIEPLAFIRGRSLLKRYLIVDEAQNLTPHEVKAIITRAGEGTKIVFVGDIEQIDNPYLSEYSNGLSALIDKFKGQAIYAHIELQKGERSKFADLAAKLL